MALCVISNGEPFSFVNVEADATIETDNLIRIRPKRCHAVIR